MLKIIFAILKCPITDFKWFLFYLIMINIHILIIYETYYYDSKVQVRFIVILLYAETLKGMKCRASQDHGAT